MEKPWDLAPPVEDPVPPQPTIVRHNGDAFDLRLIERHPVEGVPVVRR